MKQVRNVLVPILNREFKHPSDGWYQIEPKGMHPNARAGVVQVIDEKASVAITNRFNAGASAEDFPGMLIDHEHFRHQADQETRAFGWLMSLENRKDGIYGQIKWSTTGKAAVDGGDYRFFSTEYAAEDLTVLNNSPKHVRPMALSGLTVTNDPNNKGGKPITNRSDVSEISIKVNTEEASQKIDALIAKAKSAATEFNALENRAEQFRQSDESAADINPIKEKVMSKINTKLNLSAEATEDSAVIELDKIINRATTAEAKVAAQETTINEMSTKVKSFEEAAKVFAENQADADLKPLTNRLPADKIAALRPLLITNRAAALPLLALAIAQVEVKTAGPVLNRNVATTNPPDLTKVEDKSLKGILNRAMADKKLEKPAALDFLLIQSEEETPEGKAIKAAFEEYRNTGGQL